MTPTLSAIAPNEYRKPARSAYLTALFLKLTFLNLKWERVESMDGILEIGEEIPVKLVEIDQKTGKYRLSRKALLPRPQKKHHKR